MFIQLFVLNSVIIKYVLITLCICVSWIYDKFTLKLYLVLSDNIATHPVYTHADIMSTLSVHRTQKQ